MKTGAHLKVVNMGSHVLGVRLEGDKRKPEPDEFRVSFPGGDVSVVRCSDGSYWAHIRVDHEGASMFNPAEDKPAQMVDARVDLVGKPTKSNPDCLGDPALYHLAIRIERKRGSICRGIQP
jgi:hypothetical protein